MRRPTRYDLWVPGTFILGMGFLIGLAGCRRSDTPRTAVAAPPEAASPQAIDGIALSLGALAERAREGMRQGKLPEEVRHLGGLTEVVGMVTDAQNRDLILIGRSEGGKPPLLLDDLAIALRCTFHKYVLKKGNTLLYTPPGVSIDPDPAVLDELQRLERRIFRKRDHAAIQADLQKWRRKAQSPQKTRLLGMPPAHMGSVALQADYRMKRLVDGSEKVPGLKSLVELRQEARKHRPLLSGSFNRFWFTAGRPTFRTGEGGVQLEDCPVTLQTEAQLLVSREKIAGRGSADPISDQFCKTFTRLYPEFAREGLYADLANQFRWVAFATMVRQENLFSKSDLSPDFFLEEFSPDRADIPDTLPGVANIREIKTATENSVHYQWLMTVGGVDLGIDLSGLVVKPDRGNNLHQMAFRVRQTRPSTEAFSWRFPLTPFLQPEKQSGSI